MTEHSLEISFGYDGPPASASDSSFYHVGVKIDGKHWGEDGSPSYWPSDVTEEVKEAAISRAFVKAAEVAGVSPGDIVRVVDSPAIQTTPEGDNFKITIPPGRYRVLSISRNDNRLRFFTSDRRKKASAYLWRLRS